MQDSLGPVSEARPSIAVQMVGLSSLPAAGDDFIVYASEAEVWAPLSISCVGY